LVLVLAGTAIVFIRKEKAGRFDKAIFFTDAIGLGMFTATGITMALTHGLNDVYALVMGIITATFGGLIADILRNEVPDLLKRGELYATASGIGGIALLLGKYVMSDDRYLVWLCVTLVVATRIYSRRKGLRLPDI
jgi:uncharacterized membrane protein YeiH